MGAVVFIILLIVCLALIAAAIVGIWALCLFLDPMMKAIKVKSREYWQTKTGVDINRW